MAQTLIMLLMHLLAFDRKHDSHGVYSPPHVALPDIPGALLRAPVVALALMLFAAEELKDMAFECTLMEDPVVAADGHTYDREQIQIWLQQHDISPLTNEPLQHSLLIPNMDKRRQINTWLEERGLPARTFRQPVVVQSIAGGGAGSAPILKPARPPECEWEALKDDGYTARELRLAGCDFASAKSLGYDVFSLVIAFGVHAVATSGCDLSSFAAFKGREQDISSCVLVSWSPACYPGCTHSCTRTHSPPPHPHHPLLSKTAPTCT